MRTTRKLALVVVAAVALLGLGGAVAYASLADDATPPVTTTDAVDVYFDEDAVITLTATDDEGVAYIYHELDNGVARLNRVTGGTAQTVAPWDYDRPLKVGEHTLKYWSQDVNGNVEKQHLISFVVRKDALAPTTTASGVDAGGWHDQAVTVTLTSDDGEGIGVATVTYRVDGGLPVTVAGGVAEVAVATEGAHTVAYFATDELGHAEATKTLAFGIDTTAPATTAGGVTNGGWYNHSVTVDLTAADAGSGVASITSKVDWYSQKTTAGATSSAALMVDTVSHVTDGTHTITFKATDVVGNVEGLKAFTVNVDTVKPAPMAPSSASAARGRTATLKYTVGDAVPSGGSASGKIVVKNASGKVVKTLRYAGVTVNVAQTAKFTVPSTWKVGTYKFFVYAKDTAGNAQAKVAVNRLIVK